MIVCDRLVRRDLLRPERWRLALVLPMSLNQVNAIIAADPTAAERFHGASEAERSLLTTPYFLNAFLTGGPLADTIASQMHQYFSQHALTETDITGAAEAAFAVYADSTRTFSWQRFQELAGQEIANRLEAAGAIVIENDLAHFDHHLKHDYLASRILISDRTRWTPDVFATLTFHASSFETIVMAMEQIETSALADDLLRSLYDWNLYAAGYSIAEGRASQSVLTCRPSSSQCLPSADGTSLLPRHNARPTHCGSSIAPPRSTSCRRRHYKTFCKRSEQCQDKVLGFPTGNDYLREIPTHQPRSKNPGPRDRRLDHRMDNSQRTQTPVTLRSTGCGGPGSCQIPECYSPMASCPRLGRSSLRSQ